MANMTMIVLGLASLFLIGFLYQKHGLRPPKPQIVGIDLGTTYSSIGFYHAISGNTTILADSKGSKSIPSVISFLDNGTVIVGKDAVIQADIYPRRTIYDAKRFIGKYFDFNDKDFQRDLKRYPFVIELDEKGRAYFTIELHNQTITLYPEDVGAHIVKYLKNFAEKELETTIPSCVISVPAEFDEFQRNATMKVAIKSGMIPRRIVTEPTAASLAYGLNKKKGVEYIIVFDLGGGTLDVSVIWLQGGVFVTMGMAGNNRLGGQDFNDNIQKYLMEQIQRENNGKLLSEKEDIQSLRLAIEKAKCELTDNEAAIIYVPFKSVKQFEYQLTRSKFEELNKILFDSAIEPLKAALEDANLYIEDIDEIVLVGGSTRIPKIRQIVGEFFGKKPNFGIDPDLAVVIGASIQAGVLAGGWPLQVTAMEMPPRKRKRHVYTIVPKSEAMCPKKIFLQVIFEDTIGSPMG
uniref:Heat shock 70 kDa protein 13 n=1 Tax=Rhabditophanes sp. KR3021 TaxID=114890 RepID=A0AC35UAM2_9BILA